MSYGRPGLSGYSDTPINKFITPNKTCNNKSRKNSSSANDTGDKNPNKNLSNKVPTHLRESSFSSFDVGYEYIDSPSVQPSFELSDAQSPEEVSEQEIYTFNPDFNYIRHFELEQHKGRGEGSSTTAFYQPQFSALRSLDLRKHNESVRAVAWNINGQYFASGSVDKTAVVWELDSSSQMKLHKELKGHSGSIDHLCWDPQNADRLATASSDKTVRVWNANTGETLHLIKTPGENINICWSPDGQYLAVGNKSGHISFIDIVKSQIIKEHKQSSSINEIMWNHSGIFFMLSTSQGTVVFLNFSDLSHAYTLPAHTASCFCIAIDPYGRFLATGGADGKVSVWCLKTLSCLGTHSNLSTPIRALDFSYDGQFLACASEDEYIDICDSFSGTSLHNIECTKPVNSLAWHPSRHLLGFSADDFRSHDDLRPIHSSQYQVKVFGI